MCTQLLSGGQDINYKYKLNIYGEPIPHKYLIYISGRLLPLCIYAYMVVVNVGLFVPSAVKNSIVVVELGKLWRFDGVLRELGSLHQH